MARKPTVGSRELKTRLGQYLRRVRQGETIVVTDRDEPVAELRPLGRAGDAIGAALHKLAAIGVVTLPERAAVTRFNPIRARGGTASAALSADRDERG